MIKLNGVLHERAVEILNVFPEMESTDPDRENGLVGIYIPSELEVAINYNQVTGLLSLIAWDDMEKQVVLSDDEFVRFVIV